MAQDRMRRSARIRPVIVAGSVVECLVFGGSGAYSLYVFMAVNARGDGVANDLNLLAGGLTLAVATGFAVGAFLMCSQTVGEKIVGGRAMGAAVHLGSTAIAACGAIWFGLAELRSDPKDVGYWTPWIALAVAGLVICVGIVVVASLFRQVGSDGEPRLTED